MRRRRRIEDGAIIERHRERLGEGGAAALQVGARERAADAIEIAGNLAPDIAAIEVVEPGMGEMLERRRKRRLFERCARIGRLAVEQKDRREAGHMFELGKFVGGEAGLALGDGCARFRLRNCGGEQIAKPHSSAVGLGGV